MNMEHAGGELAKIMSALLRRAPAEEAPLLAWPAVCGQAVAARTRALQFTRGLLRIEVPDTDWRVQLAALESRYRRQYESMLGNDSVRQIEFVPRVAGDSQRSGMEGRNRR